jgi:hypothetical protein
MPIFEIPMRVQVVATNDLEAHAFARKIHKLLLLAPGVEFVGKESPRLIPSYPDDMWDNGREKNEDIARIMQEPPRRSSL